MVDSRVTLVPWAACVIDWNIQGLAFLHTQDGSFDENNTVTNGVGDVTLQLLPGRGLDERLASSNFMQRHEGARQGWCTIEHVDDERKRIRIYSNVGELAENMTEIGFNKYTQQKNV